jgi:CheY-like chemotaxis protein
MHEKILLCLEDQEQHQAIADHLTGWGYHVVSAFQGTDAIALAVSDRPDLLIIDMVLPDVDGIAVLKKLRSMEETRRTLILALTGSSPESLSARLAEFDVAGVIRKPVSAADLRHHTGLALASLDGVQRAAGMVLIVEHGEVSQRLLKPFFESFGCRPLFTNNFAAARLVLKSVRPQALVIGLESATDDALDLLKEATDEGRQPLPVLAIAGSIRPDAVRTLSKFGVSDILLKPFTEGRLRRALQRLLIDVNAPSSQAAQKMKSVLLVEDIALSAKALASLLEQAGYHVVQAANAKRALQVINKEKPDLMLLDVILPDLDGVEFLHRLEQAHLALPFAVVTGMRNPAKVEELKQLGALRIFEKPVHSEDLLAFMDGLFA